MMDIDKRDIFLKRGKEILDIIKNRRSVRKFDAKEISKEDLDELVEAGIYAPSGSNWQNQRFLVITDKSEIERIGRERFVWPWIGKNRTRIREKNPEGLLGRGTALIIVFSDAQENDRRMTGEYHIWESLEIQNASASIENILILATAKGIGTCWVSASDNMNYTRMFSGKPWWRVLSNYDIPKTYKMQGIIVCGYPYSYDESFYPKGEKNHGATIWQEVKRKPVDHYLIKEKDAANFSKEASVFKKILVLVLSKLIIVSIKITKSLDYAASVVELGQSKSEKHH